MLTCSTRRAKGRGVRGGDFASEKEAWMSGSSRSKRHENYLCVHQCGVFCLAHLQHAARQPTLHDARRRARHASIVALGRQHKCRVRVQVQNVHGPPQLLPPHPRTTGNEMLWSPPITSGRRAPAQGREGGAHGTSSAMGEQQAGPGSLASTSALRAPGDACPWPRVGIGAGCTLAKGRQKAGGVPLPRAGTGGKCTSVKGRQGGWAYLCQGQAKGGGVPLP